MLRNSLIALSAAAALGVALAPTAEAKTRIGFNIHVGAPVGYVAFGTPRYIYAGGGCHYVTVKHKKLKANGRLKVWYSKNLVCY